jgi:hypothetical protein
MRMVILIYDEHHPPTRLKPVLELLLFARFTSDARSKRKTMFELRLDFQMRICDVAVCVCVCVRVVCVIVLASL